MIRVSMSVFIKFIGSGNSWLFLVCHPNRSEHEAKSYGCAA